MIAAPSSGEAGEACAERRSTGRQNMIGSRLFEAWKTFRENHDTCDNEALRTAEGGETLYDEVPFIRDNQSANAIFLSLNLLNLVSQ